MDLDGRASLVLLYPGDRAARDRSDPRESRFAELFAAFTSAGIRTEPAIYHDDFAGEVAAQLRHADAALVWHNPIEGGRRRDKLDALLREAAARGLLVSTHPDTILRLGTKDILFDTRDLPFGSDVHRIESLGQLKHELPARLQRSARVLKQHRGHSGIGVWRVEAVAGGFHIRHAQRGSTGQVVDMQGLLGVMAPYFEADAGGHMIDQAWQPRLSEGMVRAYLVEDKVCGFGHQAINALFPGPPAGPSPAPGPRLYHGPDLAGFQGLRNLLELEWVRLLADRVGLSREQLPLLWDCDFMLGERSPGQDERYVLCEINVSSVAPFPPSCTAPLVAAVRHRLAARRV